MPEPEQKDPSSLLDPADWDAFRAEAHNRISSPLYSLALTLVGLFTLLGGHFDRRGQSRRIIWGGVTVLLIQGVSIGLAYRVIGKQRPGIVSRGVKYGQVLSGGMLALAQAGRQAWSMKWV